jgi:hypothetical protein
MVAQEGEQVVFAEQPQNVTADLRQHVFELLGNARWLQQARAELGLPEDLMAVAVDVSARMAPISLRVKLSYSAFECSATRIKISGVQLWIFKFAISSILFVFNTNESLGGNQLRFRCVLLEPPRHY